MPKPGNSPNVSNPEVSQARGLMDAIMVGRGSRQTPDTAQTASTNPRRLIPTIMPAGPSGTAAVEVSGIMEEQGRGSDTESTAYNYNFRKKKLKFVSDP